MTNNIVIATINAQKIVIMFTLFNNEEQLSRTMKTAKTNGNSCTTMSREQAEWSLKNNVDYTLFNHPGLVDIMTQIEGTNEAWENGELGCDPQYAVPHIVSEKENDAINAALGLEEVTIRLEKEVVDQFKQLAQAKGVGYKTLMRVALKAIAVTGNFTL